MTMILQFVHRFYHVIYEIISETRVLYTRTTKA